MKILETERTILREVNADDAKFVFNSLLIPAKKAYINVSSG